jgi:hypothetical protein
MDRKYCLEVWVDNPENNQPVLDHTSWFEHPLDPPTSFGNEVEYDPQDLDSGVGDPIVRITTPDIQETMTVKLYSSSDGVIQSLTEVLGNQALEMALPKWNRWYWVSGWRDSDNQLVMSLWFYDN